jgi:hypothetical protein
VKISRPKLLAGAVFVVLAAGALSSNRSDGLSIAPQAQAQNIGQRVVEGTVVDASSNVVSGATVFLKDLKTKSIRSFTSDPKGRFRFTQVNMAEDHELWAEKNGHKSAVKTVSEWDARKDFETELKMK